MYTLRRDPNLILVIFLGHSTTQKGYKCFWNKTKRFFTSRDVTFLENTPYFSPHTSLQGEQLKEAKNLSWELNVLISSTLHQTFAKNDEPYVTSNPQNPPSDSQNTQFDSPEQVQNPPCDSQNTQSDSPELVFYQRRRVKDMNLEHNRESNPMVEPPVIDHSSNNDLDKPIALRKGIRVKRPIEKFDSYTNLSTSFQAFTSSISSVIIPRNIKEALNSPE
ncbi:hypothetical protein LIER_32140 [Lithospermum erythrorhizon]|uniref:Retroviral polymerase SH3-like domain-containing protein n=1 Tax=Lithospermum erythrorhizon TaxID=34254 RepID=A0AAV3RUA0_LITER